MTQSLLARNDFEDNKIVGNTFLELEYAIQLIGNSENNLISENTMNTFSASGININCGSNNKISQNLIEQGQGDGIRLHSSTDDQITGNKITGMSVAIYGATASVISHNNITGNGDGISGALNNTIFENNILDNSCGIAGDGTGNNRIYRNNFINNTVQTGYWIYKTGRVPLAANTWDNGVQGNYWADYNGTDQNRDGIGDTPYLLDVNNQDKYPLLSQVNISMLAATTPTSTRTSLIPELQLASIFVTVAVVLAALLFLREKTRKKQQKPSSPQTKLTR